MAVDGIYNFEFVQRPEVTAAIEKVLTPRHGDDLIVGNHGTGKISLVCRFVPTPQLQPLILRIQMPVSVIHPVTRSIVSSGSGIESDHPG